MPAGEAVINPLELLNLKEVKDMLDQLPTVFNWVILDSPPLLFAADANLLSTLCHGTILVVRIGAPLSTPLRAPCSRSAKITFSESSSTARGEASYTANTLTIIPTILRGKTTRKKKWKKPNPKPKPETSVDEHSLTWDTDPLLTHWL